MKTFYLLLVCSLASSPIVAQTSTISTETTTKTGKVSQKSSEEEHNYLKASHFQQQQMYAEALFHFNKITELAPDNHIYHYEKGTTLIHLNNFTDAHNCFQNTISLKNDYANAHLMLGFLHAKQGKIDSAIECYKKAFIYEQNPANKLSYKLVLLTLLDKNNKLANAQEHITDAMAMNIPDELLLFYQGKMLNLNGNYEAARIPLIKAVELLENIKREEKENSKKKAGTKKTSQVSHNLVTLHHKHSMQEEDAKYYFELYKANFNTKRYAEARKLIKKAYFEPYKQELDEMNVNYLYDVALAYHKVFQFTKSKILLNKITALSPNFTAAHRLNAQIKDAESDKTIYINQVKKSLGYVKDRASKEKLLKILMPLELFKGNYEGVIATANEVLKIRATDHNALFLKAIALDKMNKPDESIALLQKMLTLKNLGLENYAMYSFQLGLIGEKVHNKTLTLASFQRSNYYYFKHAAQYELYR
jgi:tetratricopeptide (TPR) repeat protein